jgi:hypothetical protein
MMDASKRRERAYVEGESQGTADTVHLKKLFPGEGRKYSPKGLGKHGFSRSRSSYHKKVVMPRRGDLQGPFRLRLPLDFPKIHLGSLKGLFGRFFPLQKRKKGLSAEMAKKGGEIRNPVGLHAVHQGNFTLILPRNVEGNSEIPGKNGSGNGTPHTPKTPVQGELPQEKGSCGGRHNASLHGQPHRYGKIQKGSLLGDIRRSEVDGDTSPKRYVQTPQSRPDAFSGLPDRHVRQSDQGHHEKPPGHFHFHFYPKSLGSPEGYAPDGAQESIPPVTSSKCSILCSPVLVTVRVTKSIRQNPVHFSLST